MTRNDSFGSNVLFAVSSNLAVALVSALTTLIIPKFLGVEEYGYWQLFVFYGSYALLLQFGISDGANLRYAGLQKRDLSSRGLGIQAIFLTVFVLAVSFGVIALAPHFTNSQARLTVIQLVAGYAAIINVRHFLMMQLQSTNDFRTYSRFTLIDRSFFSILVIFLLFVGVEYWHLASVEIASKFITLLGVYFVSRRTLKVVWSDYRLACFELLRNIYAGVKLTVANTSNMLILGVTRFLIDRTFGVVAFGAISLTLNLSSFFMVFVNAVGLVLFPTLRRARYDRLPSLYETTRLTMSMVPLLLLIIAYPLMKLVELWLPEYQAGIQYLVILMPMIAFESRMGFLINPFMKTLRKENILLVINVGIMVFSTFLSFISTIVLKSLDLAILSIVLSLGLRAILAELYLLRTLGLRLPTSSIAEIVLVFLSVGIQLTVGGMIATALLAFLVATYALIYRKNLSIGLRKVLNLFSAR